MKIVSFNIFNGAYNPPDRLSRIIGLLKPLEADVCLLQECTGWSQAQLKLFGRSIGLNHGFLTQCNARGSGKRYNLGALSKKPFETKQSHTPELLAHGFQEITIEDCPHTIFHAHLVANSETERLKEIDWFLSEERDGILAGDLNSLCPNDPYPSDFAERLAGAGVDKYGHPPSHDVMKKLSDAGWSAPAPDDEWVTRWRKETEPPLPTRTDYILARGKTRESLAEIRVIPLQDDESDHNPLMATFS